MNKRTFNKTINLCRTKDKKRLDLEKIDKLPSEVKQSMLIFIQKNRGPILANLLNELTDLNNLKACGYLYWIKNKDGYEFVSTAKDA